MAAAPRNYSFSMLLDHISASISVGDDKNPKHFSRYEFLVRIKSGLAASTTIYVADISFVQFLEEIGRIMDDGFIKFIFRYTGNSVKANRFKPLAEFYKIVTRR